MEISDFTGKVAIVTGAGGGIGQVIASTLAQAGAKVVIAEIDDEGGNRAANEISQAGFHAHYVKTDVTDSESVKNMVSETVRVFGKLDIAVNNAATHPDSHKISDLDETTWNKVISTNLSSIAFSLKWELQQMIKQGHGGSIVNMSSVTALRAVAQLPAYTAAKQGVIALTQVAALENGEHGIRVNAIAPGATRTAMLTESLKAMGLDEDAYAQQTYILKRVATAEEVAEATAWLASEKSAIITGVTLPVDGGFSIM